MRRPWDRNEGADEEGIEDPAEPPIEPGSPRTENVVFVILGALLTVLVFLRIFGIV